MSFQNWEDKDWLEFLKDFYRKQLALATAIGQGDLFVPIVFEKIAPPAVYLKEAFEKWQKKNGSPQVEKPKPTIEKPAAPESLQWHDTNNPDVKRLNENEAPEWLVQKAKAAKYGSGLWFTKPKQGYQHGSVFKNVTKYQEA